MIINPPCNELFFPKLTAARSGDAPLEAACVKIEKKLEKYALSRGINPDELRLFDVCDAGGEMHPKLRLYIDRMPKLAKQTTERYEQYKEEISSIVKRAIDAVVTLISGVARNRLSDGVEGEIPVLLRHDHPVLTEIFDLLPREQFCSKGKDGFQRGKSISENGCLFYLSCAEALKHCPASSLHQFLTDHRPAMFKSFAAVCVSSPEKINCLIKLIYPICKKVGVKIPPQRKRIPLEEWPSPLREEMQVYQAAAQGKLLDGLEEKIAQSGVSIEIRSRVRKTTLISVQKVVEFLLFRYCLGRERLSVRDLLSTTEKEIANENGGKRTVYYNAVLTPYRESERQRADDFKRANFDSVTFAHALTYLLSLAAYNGIFEYHEVNRKAFTIKLDVERIEQRKAEKKAVIKRQGLDQWIEDNWSEYERILTQGLFKRDISKRGHRESDRNMRFVLHYCRITTMKIMGYRQRQIRDCLYGVNLMITESLVEFNYPAEKTKKGKPLHFRAESESAGKTHGRLIRTLYLFHRHAFPYVQANLKGPQKEGDERYQEIKAEGQFFVYTCKRGKFAAFHPDDSSAFAQIFKAGCSNFLKHPDLQKEAAHMIHPHYLRGASMDTQIEDNGMSMSTASRYFGASEQVIRAKYKDRNATQDASRDVILLNAQMEELETRKKRNQGGDNGKTVAGTSEAEVRELRRQLSESQERERQKDERIAKLEERLDRMQASQDVRHDEIMEALRRSGNGRSSHKG